MVLKVLNLYAGIGGNRKLWNGVDVTAVEIEPKIAKIYQDFFPKDKVIIGDAHQYLLEHYNEYDFIWSSPPCPTHSRLSQINNTINKPHFPDMKLYEEIIFLQNFFKGKYCIENVISYYDPLIKPQLVGNHYYWANFIIAFKKEKPREIAHFNGVNTKDNIINKSKNYGYDLTNHNISLFLKEKILKNCVEPKTGKHIFDCAFKLQQKTILGDT